VRSAALLAQHRRGERHEGVAVEELDFAAFNAEQAVVVEAAEDAADGFGGEAEVVGDVGARHRQLEAVGRDAAFGEAERNGDTHF
jgi:hypothetical protein